MKKKLMQIILNSTYGGAERHVVDICRNIDKTQFDLSIMVPANSKIEETVRNIDNVKVLPVERGMQHIPKIGKCIAVENPDMIHVHSPRATLMISIATTLANYKGILITTAHGWIPKRLKLHKPIEKIYTTSLKKYNKIIAVSNEVKETLIANNFKSENIFTIYNGVETYPSYRNTVKGTKRIIFLGRFVEEKGISYLAEAIRNISKGELNNEFNFDFYGDGPLKVLITDLIKELDSSQVRYCGFLNPNKVITSISDYDLLVMPSLQEGFPYTLVESFSVGVPVIATRVGGIPEALKDGYNGYLVEPKNSKDLQAAIEKFLQMEDHELLILKENAFKTSSLYSIEKMIEQLENIYNGA
jgi:L-malate glycosyltransferase